MLQSGWNVDKKSIFTVKIPLIAPTLGGWPPPDLYIGGAGPPLAPPPPVPTPMMYILHREDNTYLLKIFEDIDVLSISFAWYYCRNWKDTNVATNSLR